MGIVDDLRIDGVTVVANTTPGTAPPTISHILTGHVLLTRVFGGRPPLSHLQAIPWRAVEDIGTVVRLDLAHSEADTPWMENWLRERIIARIPERAVHISDLLGLSVHDTDERSVGTVIDVRLSIGEGRDDIGPAPALFGLVISPRTRYSYLGYERSDMTSPRVLAALLRWSPRHISRTVARRRPTRHPHNYHSHRLQPLFPRTAMTTITGQSWAPPQMRWSLSAALRSVRVFSNNRDTCICDTPIRRAISDWL